MTPFDTTRCTLGEGPLWHPERGSLFWFDIMQSRLYERGQSDTQSWQFDEHVSAAGWVDHDRLLMASQTALWRFDIATGERHHLIALEAENPITRSNDGRADPWGGFWIGTMGLHAEPGAGAIYRYSKGTLKQLHANITVSNAICFAPDRSAAYFTDTPTQIIMRQSLDAEGWPNADAAPFIDLSATSLNPDGAVTDASGTLWVAFWDAGKIGAFAPDGTHIKDIDLPALRPTCPAFGGPDLHDLYATSAATGLDAQADQTHPHNGCTFRLPDIAQGRAEPQVIL
jgi:sugar lactone lactonase YvrE